MVSPIGPSTAYAGTALTTRSFLSPAEALGLSSSDSYGAGSKERDPFDRGAADQFRAGFGDGTVSGPAAMYTALDKGLTEARRIVPSLEDVQEQRRARREEKAEEEQTFGFRRLERRRVEASAVARNFINRIDEAAGTATSRLNGEEPAEPGGATIQVNGATFTFTQGVNGTNLDVRA